MTQYWLAPQVVPSSTVSGRSVEPLFLTLPARARNKGVDKIGFAVKSTHRFADDSPYTFIGFDFAGQELSVASIFAQAYHGGCSGSDALDKSILDGTKDNGTDVHSLTAKQAGVSRDTAKGVIYGLLYGSGVKTATNTVAQGLPVEEKSSAVSFAKSTIKSFKGTSNPSTSVYEGGVASNYFNYSYKTSAAGHAKFALFGQPIPKCLDSAYTNKSGSPAQINMMIQGVCSTNGMLTAYLIFLAEEAKLAGITDYRYSISIHDEIWFICRDSETELLAKCMVKAHIAVWSLLMSRIGIDDLPVQRLVYDIVIDVTKCLRKEANQVINTPDFKYESLGYQYYVSRETGLLTRRDYDS